MRDELAQPNQKKGWRGLAPGASFAAGGPIEDEDVVGAIPDEGESWTPPTGDNSGAGPVAGPAEQPAIPDDNSGAMGVAPQQPQAPRSRTGLDFDASHVPHNAKLIMDYLRGQFDPETAEAAKKFAMPHKHQGLSDDDANLLAVQKAMELGGPEAAWQMVQFNRGSWNAKAGFAKAAATGGDGKEPDLRAAAHAATLASSHMLDGSAVWYTPTSDGITATVKLPGTAQEQQIPLSPQQFAQAIDPMGEGQFDKVLEQGGMPAHLARASKFGTTPSTRGGDLSGGEGPQNYPVNPEVKDKEGNVTTPAYQTKGPGYNSAREEQSRRIFPKGSEDRQRNAWIASQEGHEADRQTKLDVAKTTGQSRVDAQDVRGQHGEVIQHEKSETYRDVAGDQHADRQQKMAQLRDAANNKNLTQQQRTAAQLLENKRANGIKPTESDLELEAHLIQLGKQKAPTPGAPQAATPQAATPNKVPQPQERIAGKTTVTTKQGTFVWNGRGWVKQ